jgi:anaerobic selenocysteine-containing dehydrogenase
MDCPDACSLVLTKRSDGQVTLRGNPRHPITAGFACSKIRKHIHRLNSRHRKVRPMIRKNGSWKTLSWESALNLCAEKIERTRKSPEKLLHVHGEGSKGVLKQVPKLFFNHLESSRTRGSICDAAGYLAYMTDFGSRCNHDPRDLLNSRWIINWGKDLSRSSIHLGAFVQKASKSGSRLVTISPLAEGNVGAGGRYIRIRPGTDRFLAAAVIKRFITQNLIPERIVERTRHWDDFKKLVVNQEEIHLLQQCDASLEDLNTLFRIYAEESPAATVVAAGLQRYDFGGENVRFINAVAMLSGNIGVPGGGSYYHLHNLRNMNLSWMKTPRSSSRRSFLVPILGQEILTADPPIEMIWVNASNFVNQLPDIATTVRAFESIPFKVVVDAFMTDTACRADLFLPTTLMMEHQDIVGSYLHDFVHHVAAIFDPPGEARSDYEILADLGARLNPPIVLPDPDTIFSEALRSEYLDISFGRLKQERFVRANRPFLPYEDLKFDHSDTRYRLPTRLHPEPGPPGDYPYRLLTLIRRNAIHSQMLPEDQHMPPTVWISPENPLWRTIDTDKPAHLISRIGMMEVRVKPMEGLHPEVIVYRRGDWMKLGGGINRLIEASPTDIGGGTAFYNQYVTITQR